MKESDKGIKWFNTEFYPNRNAQRASRYHDPDGVLARLRQPAVTLFTPWGPRYSYAERGSVIRPGDRELETLRALSEIWTELRLHLPDRTFRWLFLGADLYGTRINFLPRDAVRKYFDSLAAQLAELIPNAEFRLWSDFDSQAEPYRQQVWKDFRRYINPDLLTRAENTARGMGRGSSPRAYLVERIAEAMLIEEQYRPIKLSSVNRHKDAGVDGDLPCLYLLPDHLHAPWL